MHHHAHRFPWVLGIETRLCTTGVSLTVLISSPLSFFPLTGSLNLILAENDLKVLILLPSAPQCWNYGCVSPCPVHVVLEMEPRALLECQARTLPTEPRLQAPCFSFLWLSDSHSEIHATCPLSLFSTPQTPSDSHGRRWTPRRAAGGGGAQKVHGVKSALSSVCRASLQVSLAYLHNSFSKSYQTPHCTPTTSSLGG